MHTYVLGCPYSPRVQYNMISLTHTPFRINIPSTFQETPWANIHGDCVGYLFFLNRVELVPFWMDSSQYVCGHRRCGMQENLLSYYFLALTNNSGVSMRAAQ